MRCPDSHEHGVTVTCYDSHGCRCGDCVVGYSVFNLARSRYQSTKCDVCRGPVVQPRATCEPCVEACMELWREEHAA